MATRQGRTHNKSFVREEAQRDRFIPANTKHKAARSVRSTREPTRNRAR